MKTGRGGHMKFLASLIGGRKHEQPAEAGPSVDEVVTAYEDVLSRAGGGEVRRLSDLPYDKPLIKQALMTAMELANDEERRFALESNVVSLGDFQDFEACQRRGLSPEEARVQESKALLAELKTR